MTIGDALGDRAGKGTELTPKTLSSEIAFEGGDPSVICLLENRPNEFKDESLGNGRFRGREAGRIGGVIGTSEDPVEALDKNNIFLGGAAGECWLRDEPADSFEERWLTWRGGDRYCKREEPADRLLENSQTFGRGGGVRMGELAA